ncbi:hypothetical protein ACHAWF_016448, partial [Thalassiosira exigua]
KVLRQRRRLLLLPLPFVLAFVLRRIPLPSGRARKAKAAKVYVPPAVVAEEEEGSVEEGEDGGAGGSFGAESRAEPSAAGRKVGGRDESGGEPREGGLSAAALAGGAPPAATRSGGGAAGVGEGFGGLRTRASSPASDPYALARSQSHGFFYDMTDAHWKRHRRIFEEHEDHRYPYAPWTHHPSSNGGRIEHAVFSYESWYQENYEPNFSCDFEKRVGVPTNGDGGKWVCDPHRIRTLAKARRARDPSHLPPRVRRVLRRIERRLHIRARGREGGGAGHVRVPHLRHGRLRGEGALFGVEAGEVPSVGPHGKGRDAGVERDADGGGGGAPRPGRREQVLQPPGDGADARPRRAGHRGHLREWSFSGLNGLSG